MRAARRATVTTVVILSLLASPPASAPRAQNRGAAVERRINQLLARMTLEEKLGQLQQLDGHADGRY
ncbi:MAG TPA: hypothetical protein VER08_06135, partial [Pyrinomonadaceae bacterium]|nr:hypothetical protein [Pyrinomonadaceae bacterium]